MKEILVQNLVKDILKNNNYEIEAPTTSNGWYLSGIKNADNGKTKIPDVIKNMDTQVNGEDIIYPPDDTAKNVAYPDLSEFSYHRNAGWMYSVNGEFPNVGMAAWIPKDGGCNPSTIYSIWIRSRLRQSI